MKNTLLAISLALLVGCASAPVNTYKAEGVVITSVDTGMRIWADWANGGHASKEQVDAVHKSYDLYYTSQMAAKAALELWVVNQSSSNEQAVNTAQASVQAARVALIDTITKYINNK